MAESNTVHKSVITNVLWQHKGLQNHSQYEKHNKAFKSELKKWYGTRGSAGHSR